MDLRLTGTDPVMSGALARILRRSVFLAPVEGRGGDKQQECEHVAGHWISRVVSAFTPKHHSIFLAFCKGKLPSETTENQTFTQ